MPHSPYQTTVYAPIRDLESYRRSLNRYRAAFDDDEDNDYRGDEILDLAEPLLEQVDFLEEKLNIKVMDDTSLHYTIMLTLDLQKSALNKLDKSYTALNGESDRLKTENTALKDENVALKEENKALKDEVAALENGANENTVK
ncbi:MAG: hypothetical protein Q9210_007543, partial [Variospora velana]